MSAREKEYKMTAKRHKKKKDLLKLCGKDCESEGECERECVCMSAYRRVMEILRERVCICVIVIVLCVMLACVCLKKGERERESGTDCKKLKGKRQTVGKKENTLSLFRVLATGHVFQKNEDWLKKPKEP